MILGLRRLELLLAAMVVAVPFCLPGVENDSGPGYDRSRFAVGLPFSPWCVATAERTTARDAANVTVGGGVSTDLVLRSWSWLLPAASLGLVVWWGRAQASRPQAPVETST